MRSYLDQKQIHSSLSNYETPKRPPRRQMFGSEPVKARRRQDDDRIHLPSIKNNSSFPFRVPETQELHRFPRLDGKAKTPQPKKETSMMQVMKQQFDDHAAYKTRAGLDQFNKIKKNQDAILFDPEALHEYDMKVYGVFDGHGINGHLVSSLIKQQMPINLWRSLKGVTEENIYSAISKAFLTTNQEVWMANFDTNLAGSTVVCALIWKNKIYCANVGDSRAIMGRLVNGRYQPIPLSNDHKPTVPAEKDRIIKSGGRVDCQRDIYGKPLGPMRVWLAKIDMPGLAMTRSFGDKVGAQAGVTADPEILDFNITENDHFLVVASDGIWEYITDQEVVKVISQYVGDTAERAAEALMKVALQTWKKIQHGRDDISVIVVFLKG